MSQVLASWRPGPTRDVLVDFLDRADSVAPADRLACFDNDGTLWVERPTYLQWDFLVDGAARRVADDPSLLSDPALEAVISRDAARLAEIGLPAVGLALSGLFAGIDPQAYRDQVRAFAARARHSSLDRPLERLVYQPMLELVAALREREFTVAIVTGGGVEFVRAVSEQLYGVRPELVVGTAVEHEVVRDEVGHPALRRTSSLSAAGANEGEAKIAAIWSHLGRRPLLAAGNSAGDRAMLEWASARPDGLALLVDHDDPDREFAYASEAVTLAESEPITTTAARLGWAVASMHRDWTRVLD